MLARLANETGGRLTHGTNDLSLGYARAQRDQGCRYTVGFYLSNELEDTPRRLKLRVSRAGLDVRHPDHYAFRSGAARRSSGLMAAFVAPEMFQSGYVRAHVFTLQPRAKDTWEALLAVSFPVELEQADTTAKLEFGGVLHAGPRVVHSFNRRISLRALNDDHLGERRFTFLEPVEIKPGRYRLTVVKSDLAGESEPDTSVADIEIPPLTRKELMLVDTILGRPRDENVVVHGDGSIPGREALDSDLQAKYDTVAGRGSFEPLLVQQIPDDDPVLMRGKACIVGSRKALPDTASIVRSVAGNEGPSVELSTLPLALEGEGKVLCQSIFEVLPENRLEPGGYTFEAVIEGAKTPTEESLRFAVESSEAPPAPFRP